MPDVIYFVLIFFFYIHGDNDKLYIQDCKEECCLTDLLGNRSPLRTGSSKGPCPPVAPGCVSFFPIVVIYRLWLRFEPSSWTLGDDWEKWVSTLGRQGEEHRHPERAQSINSPYGERSQMKGAVSTSDSDASHVAGRRPLGRLAARWRDYKYTLNWEGLRVPPERTTTCGYREEER